MFKKVDSRKKYSEMEKEILAFWKENNIFEKSVKCRNKAKAYSFYDGPPFITGVPHHGTLLSSVVKDCVPRYWTMKGYRVKRRWGWDCHGLPAENMVEKKLGIKSKREIEEVIGIEKFNRTCLEETSKIASEWKEVIDRIGRMVEFKNAYKTMDKDYMESVWWAFKQLYDKGLIYEDVRISLYCPRCSTPLSNFEIAMDNSYETDKDTAVFVKFEVAESKNDILGTDSKTKAYFLAWTTTPWTLLANVALAVNPKITYVMVRMNRSEEVYILAKDRLEILDKGSYIEIQSFAGADIEGFKYKPIFDVDKESIMDGESSFIMITEDFVTTEGGTGIVHIAPAFGEDDFKARERNNLSLILNVDDEGRFSDGIWKGKKVWDANQEIVEWLEKRGCLFKKEEITHSYPHCHRCRTKLIYKVQPAWYVNVDKIKTSLIEKNKNINWHPEALKYNCFQKGIESAPDWNISRDRYWGTGIPVWKCENEQCNRIRIFGSYEELKKISGVELEDYHRPYVDDISFKCEKCGAEMKRVRQIFDSWIEAGSMPFAQYHYPFENKKEFEESFPADFISEYIGQTRAWFYVMHVISTGIFNSESFKNVIITGNIAGEDGRKMSKSSGNYTDPMIVLEKYSADALRFYFLSSPLLNAQNVNFSEEVVRDIQLRLLGTLWNSYSFLVLYASVDKWTQENIDEHEVKYKENLLDRWILSELHSFIKVVDEGMEAYDIVRSVKSVNAFVDDLSNWYIRRSRRRFWKSENDQDKEQAYSTLWTVLVALSKVIAPFCPFIAEEMFKNLTGEESVHLADFPISDDQMIDGALSGKMKAARKAIELGLSIRAEKGIKVRQPLASAFIDIKDVKLEKQFLNLIVDELNVKKVVQGSIDDRVDGIIIKDEKNIKVGVDTTISEELTQEGNMREFIRRVQNARKKAGFDVSDRILLWCKGLEDLIKTYQQEIAKEVLATKIQSSSITIEDADYHETFNISGKEATVWLKKDIKK
ncbi:MAG: isoleucine--tRNA ligase [Patescibacteria group bacterium]|nr:isoleucine--tRNA ligase [Patescibacteria group bacterium]